MFDNTQFDLTVFDFDDGVVDITFSGKLVQKFFRRTAHLNIIKDKRTRLQKVG